MASSTRTGKALARSLASRFPPLKGLPSVAAQLSSSVHQSPAAPLCTPSPAAPQPTSRPLSPLTSFLAHCNAKGLSPSHRASFHSRSHSTVQAAVFSLSPSPAVFPLLSFRSPFSSSSSSLSSSSERDSTAPPPLGARPPTFFGSSSGTAAASASGGFFAPFAARQPNEELLSQFRNPALLSASERQHLALQVVRRQFAQHEGDCGSSPVQIALLTSRIKHMAEHLQRHKKDNHSRRGLHAMLSRRRKLLKYLRRRDWEAYCHTIVQLGLRDRVDVQG